MTNSQRTVRQGRPATLAALIERIHCDCASDDAFQEIYQDEPMEVGAVGYAADEIKQLQQEIAALKFGGQAPQPTPEKESRLEQRIKDLAGENAALHRALDDRGRRGNQDFRRNQSFPRNQPPRQRTNDGLICFRCGKRGHIKRACHATASATDARGQGNALTGSRM